METFKCNKYSPSGGVFIVVKWNTAGRRTVQRIVQRTWLDGGTRLAFLPCLWRRYGLQRHSRRQHLHHRLGLRPQRIAARQLSEQQRREAMQLSGFPLQPFILHPRGEGRSRSIFVIARPVQELILILSTHPPGRAPGPRLERTLDRTRIRGRRTPHQRPQRRPHFYIPSQIPAFLAICAFTLTAFPNED